ncbi:hypothetical protein Tco_0767335 [Tanacetum coccineum]
MKIHFVAVPTSPSPHLSPLKESELIWEEARKEFEVIRSDSFPRMDDLVVTIPEECADELANTNYSLDNDLINTILEMFTDEHALDYSSPPLYDDVDDDLDYSSPPLWDDVLYGILQSDLLPFPECDSVFYEDFSEVNALSSTNNEDKVFNPGILIHDNLFEVTNFATPDKNVKKTTNASLILEDFNLPLYELPFYKEVPGLGALLSFSSENEEKVFNPGILTSKRVHTSLLPELPHRGTKAFKVTKILESPMEIFPCSYQEDIRVLDEADIREKDEKSSQNDKTGHGVEKRGKAKVKS